MAYKYLDNGNKKSFRIYNVETKSLIGNVARDGTVWVVNDGDNLRVAEANRLYEAGPALAAHYDSIRSGCVRMRTISNGQSSEHSRSSR